jgi:hypothetical protein
MSSITQNATLATPTRNPHAHEPMAADCAAQPTLTGDYLLERWLPVLGPDKYALVCVLHNQCHLDLVSGELVTEFPLDLDDLAKKAGMSRAKVCRLLKRDAAGTIIEQRPDGTTSKSDLNRFVKIANQHHYSEKHGRRVQAVNRFTVLWPVPAVPGDEAYHALLTASHSETLYRANTPPPYVPHNLMQPGPVHAKGLYEEADAQLENLKMSQQSSFSPSVTEVITSNGLLHRTIRERRTLDEMSTRKAEKKTLVGGEPGAVSQEQRPTKETSETRQGAPASSKQTRETVPTPFDLALAVAEHEVGHILTEQLCQCNDPNPAVGMKTILIALVNAGAPLEKLRDLAALGGHRLRRWHERGGQIRTTEAGYFINLMRNLANEAKSKAWDTDLMELEDQIKHEQIMRRRAAHSKCTLTVQPDQDEAPVIESEQPEEGNARDEAQEEQEAEREARLAYEAEQQAIREETRYYAALPSNPQARQVWQSVLERIRSKVSQSAYTTWFSGTCGHTFDGDALIVWVGSGFARTHLENRFRDLIESAVHEQWDEQTSARFVMALQTQEDDALEASAEDDERATEHEEEQR